MATIMTTAAAPATTAAIAALAANATCYFHAKAALTADTAPHSPPPQGRRRGLPPAGQAPRPDTRLPAELSPLLLNAGAHNRDSGGPEMRETKNSGNREWEK